MKKTIRKTNRSTKLFSALILFLLFSSFCLETFGQRRKPIGTLNGQPVYTEDVLENINNDSPFMPALDDERNQKYLTEQPPGTQPTPSATPIPTPAPRPPAPSFDKQMENMMKTAQGWLFASVLNNVIKPALPYLMFFAWIIASFVLIISFLRKFSDERGFSFETLLRWGARTAVFMLIIGSAPYLIDLFTLIGKQIAKPVKSANVEMVRVFDEKMKSYVKAHFSVEDPNALLAERLPNGQPGILGVINNKESSVADVTAELNFLNWNMPRMFSLVVISQNIIKFGGIILALACLFILIGLKLAAPIMAALGFDDKFAAQTFYPFCWGVATFCFSYPIVKEVAMYIAYSIGLIALSIYNSEALYTLDPNTAKIIANGNYDSGSSAAIVTFLFFIAALSYILSVVLAYKLLRGQVYESVNQVSMGWMLSAVGTALETYGLVAGAAINRQAENTQIHGINAAEKASAKGAFDAGKLQTEAKRVQAITGVQGSLQTTLGQIYGASTTNILMTNSQRVMQLAQTRAATGREITAAQIDGDYNYGIAQAENSRQNRVADGEYHANNAQIASEMAPGSSVIGSQGFYKQGQGLVGRAVTGQAADAGSIRNDTGRAASNLYFESYGNQTDHRLTRQEQNARQYQSSVEQSINQNADASIAAIERGAGVSAGAAKQGAATQIGGIGKAYNLEMQANDANFQSRVEAADINKTAAEEAAQLRMVATVVTGFFRDMDRRIEEMKPKY
jgi:hypothetical protein